MIEIKTIATGSTGNCYRLQDGKESLMLDCGVNFNAIQRGFDFQLSSVSGCLISHSHKDHCSNVGKMVQFGVGVWVSEKTREEIPGLSGQRVNIFQSGKQFKVGSFTVLPFQLQHDVENHGFLIQSKSGKVLYITDSYYCRFVFKGITHFMVEANYSDEILSENIKQGLIHPTHANRIKRSHFSIENVKKFFQANDLSKCREIHLIHASDTNLDKTQAVKEIQSITGCPVYAKGL